MTSVSSNQSKRPAPTNFLEAFRELSRDTLAEVKTQVTQVVKTDIPESFGLSSSGTLQPNEAFSVDSLRQAENRGEQNAEAKFDARLQQMRQQERATLMRQEESIKQQIKSLQADIQQLAKSAGSLASEVEVAAFQATVNPGVYHQNFFKHLRSLIMTLRQRVESSRNWLAASNSRAKKQGTYWAQVNKSGTKFMMSSERYMVTSTG